MKPWLRFLLSLLHGQPGKTFRFLRALWHAFQYWWHDRPVLTPIGIRISRERQCGKCPKREDLFCTLCGCLLMSKTRLASESCPDEPPRWSSLGGVLHAEEDGADGEG